MGTSGSRQWAATSISVPHGLTAESERLVDDGARATLPVPNPTASFWIATPGANPLASEGSTGLLTEDADICIIGSGITGVSAAYHLAKIFKDNEGTAPKVVILEARDFCSGATGRNGGHLTPEPCEPFKEIEAAFGTKEAIRGFEHEKYTTSQILKIIKEEKLEKTVDLVEGGRVVLFVSSDDYHKLHADYDAAKKAGLNLNGFEWMDKQRMKEGYGIEFPAAKQEGYNLWPLKLVTQLYHLAKRQGSIDLSLHTRTSVTSIVPVTSSSSGRRWELVTQRGSVKCSRVIHATNSYASYLLPHLHGPDGIVPVRGTIVAVRANASAERVGKNSWITNGGSEYFFPRPVIGEESPLMIVGGGRPAAGPPYEQYVADDSVFNEAVLQALRDLLPSMPFEDDRFVKGRESEMEWTGIMGYTKIKDPFVGPVIDRSQEEDKYRGQFVSAGYSGHGMPRAFACAQAVAMMVAAEIQGKPFEQPAWLPDRYLTWNRK